MPGPRRNAVCVQIFTMLQDARTIALRNRGTAKRYAWCPTGDESIPSVALGNLLAHRCVLLAMLAHSRGVIFLLEQPVSSVMNCLPRWADLLSFCQVRSQEQQTNCALNRLMLSWLKICRCTQANGGWDALEAKPGSTPKPGATARTCCSIYVGNSNVKLH
jgi:hypothetical protein